MTKELSFAFAEINVFFPIYAFRHEHDNPSCNDIEIFENFGRQTPIFMARCKSLNFIGHRIFLCIFYWFYDGNLYDTKEEKKKKNGRIIKIRIDEIEWRSKLFNWIRFPNESKVHSTKDSFILANLYFMDSNLSMTLEINFWFQLHSHYLLSLATQSRASEVVAYWWL